MLTNRSRHRHAHANASQRQRQRDEDEENLHHSTPKPSWPNSHSRTQKKNILSSSPLVISVAFFGASLILISVTAILLLKNQHQHTKFLQLKDDSPVHEDGKDHHLLDKQVEFVALAELEAITSKLLGPDDFGNGCPPGCGCKGHPVDCPQHYSVEDVIKSADAILDISSSLYYASQLELQHADAMKKCINANNTNGRGRSIRLESGGYCLSHRHIEQTLTLPDTRIINIPKWHVLPSDRIVETLEELFRAEGVISVSDFGAGVGQYGVYLKSHIPGLIYQAYDGAGDIESYTNGFVKYSDFTQPLDLPVTEWVLSLEVGEHIPSKYEGIFIRNLHRHNCKGLILSWGVLGQDGENHINLHSNTYVMNIFHSLGYLRDFELEAKLRNPEGNHKYFVKSAMAFRRRHITCGRPVPALRRISTIAIAQNNSSIDPTSLKAPIVSKNRMPEKSFDLIKTPAADRDLDGLTVDLAYTLNVPSNWWDGLDTSPSYNSLMMSLHGKDIWRDDRLLAHLDFLGIKGDTHEIFGSPLVQGPIEALLRQYKPKIFLEVGVFRGATSTKIATFFKEEKEGWAKDSYVLSMDTWLLDLAFAWNGGKSKHTDEVKNEDEYFKVNKISGGNQMYFQFLSNCLATKTNDRIIPIQTASLNGAIALLSHGVRPDFMYIDASHANPDVFLDYENFYKILKPGGVMTFDDVKSVPACRDAFNMLARKYDLKQYFLLESTKKQGYIIKKDEKETKNVHPASASTCLDTKEYNVGVERGMTSIRSQSKVEPKMEAIPILLVIGFQKSATSATRKKMDKNHVCASMDGEPSYWSQEQFALNQHVECNTIIADFIGKQFGQCSNHLSEVSFLFAKMPTLATQPWAAPSIKTLLPRAKIALAVRDPIQRAFSGFLQCWTWIREAPSINKRQPTAEIFDELVALDMTLSRECGIPHATGYLIDDWPVIKDFNHCCRAVAESNGHKDWPGCDAFGMKVAPEEVPSSFPAFTYSDSKGLGLAPERGLGWQLTPFGGYCFSFVREGSYIHNLGPWLVHYSPDKIYAYSMTELEEDEAKILRELHEHATSLGRQSQLELDRLNAGMQRQVLTDEALVQSFSQTQQHFSAGFVPLPETVAALKEYYLAQNVALNEFFQKNLLAEYE